MFKKLTNCLSVGFEKAVDFSQNQLTDSLSRKYPDIGEVLEVLERLKGQSAIEHNEDEADKSDGKWRPMLLTIGLLYKLQKIQDACEHNWYNNPDIFVNDTQQEDDVLNVFGFYWHLCVQVAEVLRSSDVDHSDQDNIRVALQQKIDPLAIEVKLANATDDRLVDQHCPDFALLLDHPHQLIVINICGTRMMPAPKMADVFMDLYATAEPFMHGKAHRGMAIGARNILTKTNSLLREAVDQYPHYGILVTGYSLGAGICQLVAMELLQERPNIRCISYGAPLVFEADLGVEANDDYGKNLYTVVCSHDGLASASLCTVSKLFAQVRAVDDLQLKRRNIIKMLCTKIPTVEGNDMKEEDDSEGDDDFDKDKLSHKPQVVLSPEWEQIREAVSAVSTRDDVAKLTHPAKNIFVFKRRSGGEVITRYFQVNFY